MTHSVTGARDAERQPAGPPGYRKGLVIAIDGPSGSGKSSAARGAAARLGLRYLDTGAMYRAVTWWLIEHEVDLADTAAVAALGCALSLEVGTDPAAPRVRVDGVEATAQVRSRRVSNVVSLVAAVPEIRRFLIGLQRDIIASTVATSAGIVAEGRDIGTVVVPDADVKIFLTASEQVRAERRAAELAGRPVQATVDLTRAEQAQRDRRDAPQSQVAADAVEIDATDLGLDDVIERILGLAGAKRAGEG